MDCTNCWNTMSHCTCGQRRPMLAGGVIDPEDHYDGKGTKDDPLKGQNYKGFIAKHKKMGDNHLASLISKRKGLSNKSLSDLELFEQLLETIPAFLRSFLLQQKGCAASEEFLLKWDQIFNSEEERQNAKANALNKSLPFPKLAMWESIRANRTINMLLQEIATLDSATKKKIVKKLGSNSFALEFHSFY